MKHLQKHYILTLVFSTLIITGSYAQRAEDALLISRTAPTGSARILGLGGGGTALGGDVSSAFINPAGLGFYNRSQVVLTPNFQNAKTNTNFLGTNSETFDNNFNVSNFGIVINNTKDDIIPADYRGGSFSITYNQTNSYNFNYQYSPGRNTFSILDEFASQAYKIPSSELDENASNDNFPGYVDAAFYNYLINPDSTFQNYFPSTPTDAIGEQEGSLEEMGRQSEWDFSYGGNYKDKVYFGASIGFKNFSYERNKSFTEAPLYTDEYLDFIEEGNFFFPISPTEDIPRPISIDFVDYVILDETLKIDGSGINATLGVIYRPINTLTLGFSYKTPTFYGITEDYFFDLESSVSGIQEKEDSEPFDVNDRIEGNRNISEYTLSTPSKVSGGFAYFFEKYGFITADVEFVNYAANRFGSNEFNTGDVNTEIDNVMESVINYKVGGEFRYDIFRLRLGYAMYADPTQYVGDNLDRNRQVLSGGVGISTPNFFADLAVVNMQYSTDISPYEIANYFPRVDFPQSENNLTNVVLSLGFNF